MCYIYTTQYYLAVKKNDLRNLQKKRWDKKKKSLSRVTKTQKYKYDMYSLIS